MNDCVWLSDRIPAVALGRAEWTPQELRHLNECRACQQEWEVVRAAGRLGQDVRLARDSNDLATSVIQRLRSEKASHWRRRSWGFAGLAAAATIAAAVWTGSIERRVDNSPLQGSVAAGRLAIPLPELEALQPAELDSVLQTMDDPNVLGSALEEPGLGDLDSDELKTVLDTWEG